jgi:hypothetical protein
VASKGYIIMSIEHDDDNFLSRWSKRKLNPEQTPEPLTQNELQTEPEQVELEPSAETLEAPQETPIWQQQDADPKAKKHALQALFKQVEFGELDGLNEYDEDYTSFTGLGNVVTREMKRMLELAEQKTRPEAETQPQDQTQQLQQKQNAPTQSQQLGDADSEQERGDNDHVPSST